MKQSGHLNPSEETGTGCPVTSKYGRTPPNKHGGVDRRQQQTPTENNVTVVAWRALDEWNSQHHLTNHCRDTFLPI